MGRVLSSGRPSAHDGRVAGCDKGGRAARRGEELDVVAARLRRAKSLGRRAAREAEVRGELRHELPGAVEERRPRRADPAQEERRGRPRRVEPHTQALPRREPWGPLRRAAGEADRIEQVIAQGGLAGIVQEGVGMSAHRPDDITAEDWAATPRSVRVLVGALQQQVRLVQEHMTGLEQRVRVLEEQGRQTSRTSSKPPSSDPPSAPPRPPRRPSGRATGGQPGHEGHGRVLLAAAQVDRIVEVRPMACGQCGAALTGADAQPARHQVAEVPRVAPEVTEYRQHTLPCGCCGARTTAPWPQDMPRGGFGPRAQATVAYLTGRQGLSQRDAQELLGALCHLDLGLGSSAALERQVSAAVADPVAQAHAFVQAQPVANVDETGWTEGTQRRWLWVAVTTLVSVFLVRATRGSQGAKDLLGPTYPGVVGSDRWSGYTWIDVTQRQLCWAHLLRDFAAFVERGGASARLGRALLTAAEEMFGVWYRACATGR